MSLLIASVVVYGFSQTVGNKLIHASPRRPGLLWVHVVLFSGWVSFYILQSTLVRIRKVKIHRTLGWAGAALGTSMVVVGPWVAVVMARFDTNQLHRLNRDAFLIVPLTDILAFAIFLGLAILWRKNPERHRRLMLIGSCVLTGARSAECRCCTPPCIFTVALTVSSFSAYSAILPSVAAFTMFI
jgi:hypothetical protein